MTESSVDIQSLLNPNPSLTQARSSPPSTPKRHTPMLTRDQRIQIQTLRGIGWSYIDIARHLTASGVLCTERQVQWAETHWLTPQKNRSGPKALQKEGFYRRVARKKPSISEKNARLRLAWAIEHVNWTREQWDLILWTDETWVTDGRHKRIGSHEGLARRTILHVLMKEKYRAGWMFWACFSALAERPQDQGGSALEEEEWEIVRIVDKRRTGWGYEYKVCWEETWLLESELGNAQELLRQFEAQGQAQRGRKRGRPTRADKAW